MRKVLAPVIILVLAFGAYSLYQRYYPALTYLYPRLPDLSVTQPTALPTATDSTGLALKLPDGFSISYYTQGLSEPRDLEFDPQGKLLVSEPSSGRVVTLPAKHVVVSGLNRPHGLAFAGNTIFIAETNALRQYLYDPTSQTATQPRKIIDLPSGGGHWTRSLLVNGLDLYTAIGSSCNVCNESDPRRAAIYQSNLDGSDFRPLGTGLRNSVFMTIRPGTDDIWATDMGRDNLGDNLPPDEINIIQAGKNYGWPVCYGQNIHDTTFDKTDYRLPSGTSICVALTKTSSHVDIPAHSAPLGLAFIPKSWGPDYAGDLLVAYHGSWNRSIPTGYKVVRFDLDSQGNRVGESDFISGWLPAGARSSASVTGRPVDLTFDSSGRLYISDDKSGTVYLVSPPKQ